VDLLRKALYFEGEKLLNRRPAEAMTLPPSRLPLAAATAVVAAVAAGSSSLEKSLFAKIPRPNQIHPG